MRRPKVLSLFESDPLPKPIPRSSSTAALLGVKPMSIPAKARSTLSLEFSCFAWSTNPSYSSETTVAMRLLEFEIGGVEIEVICPNRVPRRLQCRVAGSGRSLQSRWPITRSPEERSMRG